MRKRSKDRKMSLEKRNLMQREDAMNWKNRRINSEKKNWLLRLNKELLVLNSENCGRRS